MKKILLYLLVPLVFVTFTKCSDDDDEEAPAYSCASCVTTPEAIAANDNSAKGIYKGIIVGSSGTIKISIDNGSSAKTCLLTIDGKTATLTSTFSVVPGTYYETEFTGMFEGQEATVGFSVGEEGSFPYITYSDIPGHENAEIGIVKETSTDLIESFEGTYKGSSSGTFNMVVSRKQKMWAAISANDYFEGAVSGTAINGLNFDEDVNVSGTLSNHVASGSWQGDGDNKGTWEAKRTQ